MKNNFQRKYEREYQRALLTGTKHLLKGEQLEKLNDLFKALDMYYDAKYSFKCARSFARVMADAPYIMEAQVLVNCTLGKIGALEQTIDEREMNDDISY